MIPWSRKSSNKIVFIAKNRIELFLNDTGSPALIKDPGDFDSIFVVMPTLSPTMTEGNLVKWFKSEGDDVEPGEVLAEIETDKATMEIESTDKGIIGKILVSAGTESVKVNTMLAVILEEGENLDDAELLSSSILKSKFKRIHHKTQKTHLTLSLSLRK